MDNVTRRVEVPSNQAELARTVRFKRLDTVRFASMGAVATTI